MEDVNQKPNQSSEVPISPEQEISPPDFTPPEYVPSDSDGQSFPLKKILSLLIGFVIVLAIIASVFIFVLPKFGGKTSEDVTLTYWGTWENSSFFEEVAREFHEKNPKITVRIEKQDIKSLGKYIDRLSTRANNGTGPDIFRFHNTWVYQLRNILLPLPESVVKETKLDEKFYPVIKEDMKLDGAYYGVPIHFDVLALFVNPSLFQAAGITEYPSTWDDLGNSAKKLTVKDQDGKIITSGVALGTFDNIAHAPDIISLLMIQNGAKLTNLNSTMSNAVDALDFYTSFAKDDSKVWDETLENSKLAFAKGNLAMYLGYSWDIFEIKAINPDFEFGVVPVPHLPERNDTIASYWAEGVSAKSAHPKEAFEFLKFLASRETMEKLYEKEAKTRLFGEIYPRSDMAELLKSNNLIYPFALQGNNAKSTIFSSDTHDEAMIDSFNSYLGDTIRSINKNNSTQTAVESLSLGISQIIERGK